MRCAIDAAASMACIFSHATNIKYQNNERDISTNAGGTYQMRARHATRARRMNTTRRHTTRDIIEHARIDIIALNTISISSSSLCARATPHYAQYALNTPLYDKTFHLRADARTRDAIMYASSVKEISSLILRCAHTQHNINTNIDTPRGTISLLFTHTIIDEIFSRARVEDIPIPPLSHTGIYRILRSRAKQQHLRKTRQRSLNTPRARADSTSVNTRYLKDAFTSLT